MKLGNGTQAGLTLVEILVVVLIVAILAALALPTYRDHARRGYRTDAVRGLLQIAACQERLRAETGHYDTERCTAGMNTDRYAFRIEPSGQNESLLFVAIARPLAAQAGDDCGELSLDQAGTRGTSGRPDRRSACWGGR